MDYNRFVGSQINFMVEKCLCNILHRAVYTFYNEEVTLNLLKKSFVPMNLDISLKDKVSLT